VQGAFAPLFRGNADVNFVHVGYADFHEYKLVVVLVYYVRDQASADALRRFVSDGGSVVMTAYSAKVDEHAQWLNTPLPWRLSDVFGLKVNERVLRNARGCELSARAATRGATCCVFGRHWYFHAGATECDRLINE